MSEKEQLNPTDLPEQEPNQEPEKKEKKWVPFAIAGGALVVIGGVWAGMSLGGEEEAPEPVETSSVQPQPTGEAFTAEPQQPNASPSAIPEEQKSQAQVAAENFVEKLNSGKQGEDLAKFMKAMVTHGFYESLKHADKEAIPQDVANVSVSSGTSSWTGTARGEDGAELYTFELEGYKNNAGKAVILVKTMDIPEDESKPRLDESGHPIQPPVKPLSSSALENLNAQTYRLAGEYIEFEKGESEKDRLAELKKSVHDGDIPDEVRPTIEGRDNNVQMFSPENIRMLTGANGDKVKEGFVSVGMNIKYADAAWENPEPWEEVMVAADFRWNDASDSWQPAGFRVTGVRPLGAPPEPVEL